MNPTALRRRLFFLTVLAGAVVIVFYPGLFGGGVFVYRDAAHFYYPLFEFVQSQWDAGRLPIWNPYENFGKPLVAGASSSIFYPGKLIFFSPLSYAWNFRLYTIGHIALAACGAAWVARRWRRSLVAATLAGISYAFCGSVLMQYCNVIFLVGAAWLPFALLGAERMLVRRTLRDATAFGAVLALMTLGGDPQMAYNAGLLATAYAVLLWWSSAPRTASRVPVPWSRRRPVLLAFAACTALVLAAIQVFPTIRYLRSTARAETTFSQRLRCDFTEDGGHLKNVYDFSVGPWRFVELLWPNFGGRQYPVNRRWMEAIPAESRVWTPTLYMGVLPFAAAVWGMRFRRGNRRLRWMSWTAVAAALAALGWYGIGWIVQEIGFAVGADPTDWLASPVGGVYWLMTVLLPGYAAFRYPAKLLVVAALGASIAAAYGWDRQNVAKSRGFFRVLTGIVVLSILGLCVYAAIRPSWVDWMHAASPNALFGPLDAEGAANEVLWGICQTLLVAVVSLFLLHGVRRGRAACAVFIVLLTLADLVTANRWIVAFGPADLWDAPSTGAAAIRDATGQTAEEAPFPRAYRQRRWLPESFEKTSSPDRLVESFRWDRDSLYPKFPLSERIGMLNVRGTMVSRSTAPYLKHLADQCETEAIAFPEPLPAEFVIVPGNRTVEGAERIGIASEDVGIWRMLRSRPWIGIPADASDPSAEVIAPPQYRVISFEPDRVVIEVTLDRPGTLLLTGFNDPDWQAWLESDPACLRVPLYPASDGTRVPTVPAGTNRIALRYVPTSLFVGAALSAAGWAIFAAFAGWGLRTGISGCAARSQVA